METLETLRVHLVNGYYANYKDDSKREIIISDGGCDFVFESCKVENFFDDSIPFTYQEGIKIFEKDIYGHLENDEDDEYSLLEFVVNVENLL